MSFQRTSRRKLREGTHILAVQLGDLSIRLDAGWSDGFRQYRMASLNFAQNKLDVVCL